MAMPRMFEPAEGNEGLQTGTVKVGNPDNPGSAVGKNHLSSTCRLDESQHAEADMDDESQ